MKSLFPPTSYLEATKTFLTVVFRGGKNLCPRQTPGGETSTKQFKLAVTNSIKENLLMWSVSLQASLQP